MPSSRFLSMPALAGLKDFQRKTVEYVFKRFYGNDSISRFLIADEVGLGKNACCSRHHRQDSRASSR